LRFIFNRHAGLVNLCGRGIWDLIESEFIRKGINKLKYVDWEFYKISSFGRIMAKYGKFDRLIKSLSSSVLSEAVDLLRTHFLGGILHCTPAFGKEDFILAQREKLTIVCSLNLFPLQILLCCEFRQFCLPTYSLFNKISAIL
jgi:hypothetical protein